MCMVKFTKKVMGLQVFSEGRSMFVKNHWFFQAKGSQLYEQVHVFFSGIQRMSVNVREKSFVFFFGKRGEIYKKVMGSTGIQ